ncbi:MAG: hypothetical protein MUF49_32375 [Oculatellaceae cyanobacterium Prado106]|jgi:isopenicillin N synthase-like dioxygenase|nr:hypothetical protein [Oculatellaceae cyanobacterium Prado106]
MSSLSVNLNAARLDIHVRASPVAEDAVQLGFDHIPVIDLEPAFAPDGNLAEVAQALDKACREVGFFYIKNHHVDPEIIDRAQAAMVAFFDLPLAEKMKVYLKNSPNHRGYLPMQELASGASLRLDMQEGYEIAEDLPEDDPDFLAGNKMFGPNVYPDSLPEFRQAFDAYFEAIAHLSRTLYRVIAIALHLPADFFDDKLTKPLNRIRLICYPSLSEPFDPQTLSINPHTDFEIFTILWQNNVAGLQVLNPSGQWIAAPPIPGTFVVNIGDLLARWTNDLYLSTVHRVINQSGQIRYSIPMFCGPNAETEIRCFDSCQTPESPPKYAPVTAGDWTLKRVNTVYQYDS